MEAQSYLSLLPKDLENELTTYLSYPKISYSDDRKTLTIAEAVQSTIIVFEPEAFYETYYQIGKENYFICKYLYNKTINTNCNDLLRCISYCKNSGSTVKDMSMVLQYLEQNKEIEALAYINAKQTTEFKLIEDFHIPLVYAGDDGGGPNFHYLNIYPITRTITWGKTNFSTKMYNIIISWLYENAVANKDIMVKNQNKRIVL